MAAAATQGLVGTFRERPACSACGRAGDLRRGSGSGSRRCPRRPASCWASRSTARSTRQGLLARIPSRPVSCTSTILRETRGRRRNRCRIRPPCGGHGAERKDVSVRRLRPSFGGGAGLEPVNDSWNTIRRRTAGRREPPMPTTRGGSVAAGRGREDLRDWRGRPDADASTPVIRPAPTATVPRHRRGVRSDTNKWRARARCPRPATTWAPRP